MILIFSVKWFKIEKNLDGDIHVLLIWNLGEENV
jgi:hypothetical protein